MRTSRSMPRALRTAATTLAIALAIAGPAAGDVFDAVSWTGSRYMMNGATGVTAYQGSMSLDRCGGLAVDDGDGLLFATCADNFVPMLAVVDPLTGDAQLPVTLDFGGSTADIRALSFTTDGVLIAIHSTVSGDELWSVDPTTGVGAFIGDTGLTSLQGLALALDGTVYGWDNGSGLVTVDPATGVATVIDPAFGYLNGQGLEIALDGTILLAGRTAANADTLFWIDPVSSAATEIGPTLADLRGLARQVRLMTDGFEDGDLLGWSGFSP